MKIKKRISHIIYFIDLKNIYLIIIKIIQKKKKKKIYVKIDMNLFQAIK
jgi:hypothetical protein